jgi:hypothetical protein
LGRDVIQTRDVYFGPRGSNALAFHEDRNLNFDPFVYLRVRRAFG